MNICGHGWSRVLSKLTMYNFFLIIIVFFRLNIFNNKIFTCVVFIIGYEYTLHVAISRLTQRMTRNASTIYGEIQQQLQGQLHTAGTVHMLSNVD